MTEMLTTWLRIVEQSRARPMADTVPITNFVTPLADLGLIAATGDDAATFLHNQLTNDVEHLGLAEARLAGYCSPKGRLLATMMMWKTPDAIMLQLSGDIQQGVQKRLQMFVLRAKAKLADVSDQHAVLGLAGPAAAILLSKWFPSMPATPYAVTESPAGTLIRCVDSASGPRYQWITSHAMAAEAWDELAGVLTVSSARAWRVAEISAGLPQVAQSTQDQFVPQMINFEVIGGVNFKKGCYPGQEIVARSQYLGKLKRRMYIATVDSIDARPGMDVFASGDPQQPCGMLVNAEVVSPNQALCLVEVKSAALEGGTIHLGSASGPALRFTPLPYELIDVT
ncbi:MAG: folate-binding protein YgfZ [Herminiimonas sp.]|nr:folate-binding protein YgfZ [Herminiimonas sp.]